MTENFEAAYLKEREVSQELEKVEIAYSAIKKKYEKYKECSSFIDYLRTIERVFAESKVRNWNADTSKNKLIEAEIVALASKSRLGEDIFASIYEDFRHTIGDVGKVASAVKTLLEKNKHCEECCEFILYLENVFIYFQDAERGRVSMGDLRERLVRARMTVLACDGNPEMKLLEQIFKEFYSLIL